VTAFEKWTLWSSSAVVGITGIVYGGMKYLMSSDDPFAVVHHPLQPLVLKVHLIAAPVLVFAIGAVYTRHIVRQWRSGGASGRRSGAGMAAVIVPMILSGYLIQTLTSESWLFWTAMAHIAAGTAYLAAFAAHQRSAARNARPEGRRGTGDPDA
jgi:hypothetical protein